MSGGADSRAPEADFGRRRLGQPAAQPDGHGQPRGLAALRLAADLHDDAPAFVEPPAARRDFALRQKGRAILADVDERRAERRQQAAHPAEMDAAGLGAVAALDIERGRGPVLEERRAPLARPGGD